MLGNNPYIRSRFITDAIVKNIKIGLPDTTDVKIYTEKIDKLNTPYIFVSLEQTISQRVSRWLSYKEYLMLIYSRFGNSSKEYEKLEMMGCGLYDWLEWIELPVGKSLKEGEQFEGEVRPVRGTNMSHEIVREKDYAELYFYARYKIQTFRENPIIPKMKEEKINIRTKDIRLKGE